MTKGNDKHDWNAMWMEEFMSSNGENYNKSSSFFLKGFNICFNMTL